ncbi:Rieske 2Fe-2S domain-containing protein [Moorena producens]|uniref:Rieske 2Fe-2S domain-containing protein n=1 Tax=Moorena producens TaxID=1155739 RepID=UPI003C779FE5
MQAVSMLKSRFPFTSFPNGWFRIAYSDELRPGQVKPLRYFGRDLVVFRTQQGEVHLLDAHCPHLGAHLGYGGKVKGDIIQCPFHGWCFNGQGQCVDIPYANKIPPKAQISTWPICEVNGVIMVYYHAQGEKPTWAVPELPEYTSREWTPFRLGQSWKIRTHIQEIIENAVDYAHLPFVHITWDTVKTEPLEVEGSVLKWRASRQGGKFLGSQILLATPEETLSDITCYGLGCKLIRVCGKMRIDVNLLLMFFMTPIDREYIEVHAVISLKKIINPIVTFAVKKNIIKRLQQEIQQDIPILENKIYPTVPNFCDGDAPISQYRHWARQFYAEQPVITTAVVQML